CCTRMDLLRRRAPRARPLGWLPATSNSTLIAHHPPGKQSRLATAHCAASAFFANAGFFARAVFRAVVAGTLRHATRSPQIMQCFACRAALVFVANRRAWRRLQLAY